MGQRWAQRGPESLEGPRLDQRVPEFPRKAQSGTRVAQSGPEWLREYQSGPEWPSVD